MQVLQPTAWVLFIDSCLTGSVPIGEEGIFQPLFCLLHHGCTLKPGQQVGYLHTHWLPFLHCRDWCSPTHRQKAMLKI